ncbi:N-acetylmuramoyl-L-alanine amidase [Clostridium fallax]|uniref:N-acetylmuramoyl-L-alanine amidase n=1 Tax=Clostridium fallax TaxID=1533 RepID=A0A1M4V1D2_9CLOT|nr:N-acetylmuramoyl-L-alanine amidase [Clostridium fallax]SHE62710.1 N-acetylmuramoyl-L-alanine amidase [Clostridium fallax]SQB06598.1 N-acetylmuramoyl-L-alanine amidase [Clostridium fallax]
MIIGKRAGHSDNCIGAVGIVDEHQQMKQLDYITTQIFEKYGHTVINCNSNKYTANEELVEGAREANRQYIDIFLSLHMNASNGEGHGTECWVHSPCCRAENTAKKLVNNLSKLGFYNRGVKYNSRYYEMRAIDAPNIIVETCFCDSQKDIDVYNKYSWEQLGYAICNAVDPNIPFEPPADNTKYYIETKIFNCEKYGVYLPYVLPYFKGFSTYALSYSKNIWIITQYLSDEQIEKLKVDLGDLYYDTRSDDNGKWIITQYLPYGEWGVYLPSIMKYFEGINCYLMADNKEIWFDTQWLNKEECEDLRNSLTTWVNDVKSE